MGERRWSRPPRRGRPGSSVTPSPWQCWQQGALGQRRQCPTMAAASGLSETMILDDDSGAHGGGDDDNGDDGYGIESHGEQAAIARQCPTMAAASGLSETMIL